MPKAIAIVSGGLDSITLAYLLHAEGYELHLLSFDYGQRHKKELAYAERCAKRLEVAFDIVDLSSLGRFLKGSALTDTIPVPDGHYAAPTMAITVVPNRNACRESSGGRHRRPCWRPLHLSGLPSCIHLFL